ncbi:hypothetical protein M2169_005265 [Streptomyces sp. MJP52]|nr:hypothetical protein [Streptomyces sp. MJP52]
MLRCGREGRVLSEATLGSRPARPSAAREGRASRLRVLRPAGALRPASASVPRCPGDRDRRVSPGGPPRRRRRLRCARALAVLRAAGPLTDHGSPSPCRFSPNPWADHPSGGRPPRRCRGPGAGRRDTAPEQGNARPRAGDGRGKGGRVHRTDAAAPAGAAGPSPAVAARPGAATAGRRAPPAGPAVRPGSLPLPEPGTRNRCPEPCRRAFPEAAAGHRGRRRPAGASPSRPRRAPARTRPAADAARRGAGATAGSPSSVSRAVPGADR